MPTPKEEPKHTPEPTPPTQHTAEPCNDDPKEFRTCDSHGHRFEHPKAVQYENYDDGSIVVMIEQGEKTHLYEIPHAVSEATLKAVREALDNADTTFIRYAEMHFKKGTPEGDEKANANLKEAEKMRAALALLTPNQDAKV